MMNLPSSKPTLPTLNERQFIYWGLFLAFSLAGCSSPGPNADALKTTSALTLQLPATSTTELPSTWWESLGDPQLNHLIAVALQSNPSLATAQLRVRRMQALAGLAQAAGLPQANVGADFTRQRFSANGLFPKPIAGNTWDNDILQGTVSWSPDLWGQHAAELASALGQSQASQADAAVAATGLASQIAKGYVGLSRLVAQIDIAERTLQQRQAQQTLIAQRFAAGLDTRTEQTQSDGNVSDAQSQIEALQEQMNLMRHQLAVLSGQAPQTLTALSPQLNALQLDEVPAVLGADLLGRRPDIVASRWRVEAASQDMRVARTQFYPNVNLSAFIGFNALGVNRLFNADSGQIGVTPALRLPLFDGGRLQAQLSGRQAELDMAVSQYNFTVLEAVKESADAISSDQSMMRQAQLQTAALVSAQKNHAIAKQRFDAGLGNQLIVLSAETAVLLQSRASVDIRARQLDNRINLMKALGGGWREDTPASARPLASIHQAKP
jgi:NodT family efflux transporter outer membrane factor (OMF) lipoprotein